MRFCLNLIKWSKQMSIIWVHTCTVSNELKRWWHVCVISYTNSTNPTIFIKCFIQCSTSRYLWGILWDRRWIAPSIGIKFQSDRSPNCFTIDVWNINCWRQQFIFLLSYCFFRRIWISFYTSSVVFWHVIFWE